MLPRRARGARASPYNAPPPAPRATLLLYSRPLSCGADSHVHVTLGTPHATLLAAPPKRLLQRPGLRICPPTALAALRAHEERLVERALVIGQHALHSGDDRGKK
eukprot:3259123-Prymnesium_polylepis.4